MDKKLDQVLSVLIRREGNLIFCPLPLFLSLKDL